MKVIMPHLWLKPRFRIIKAYMCKLKAFTIPTARPGKLQKITDWSAAINPSHWLFNVNRLHNFSSGQTASLAFVLICK